MCLPCGLFAVIHIVLKTIDLKEPVNFVKEFFETNTILPFTESQCFDKVDKVTVKKIKQVGYLSNLKK
mgnify:CR=1 FL=1